MVFNWSMHMLDVLSGLSLPGRLMSVPRRRSLKLWKTHPSLTNPWTSRSRTPSWLSINRFLCLIPKLPFSHVPAAEKTDTYRRWWPWYLFTHAFYDSLTFTSMHCICIGGQAGFPRWFLHDGQSIIWHFMRYEWDDSSGLCFAVWYPLDRFPLRSHLLCLLALLKDVQ